MNYDIHIENLGAIKEADITITPLTILAGENGTGKSFVTKFLYSILNVAILDVFTNRFNELSTNITKETNHIISIFENAIPDHNALNILLELSSNLNVFFEDISDELSKPIIFFDSFDTSSLEKNIQFYESEILTIFDDDNKDSAITDKFRTNLSGEESNFNYLLIKYITKQLSVNLEILSILIENPRVFLKNALKDNIINELKSNFQVSQINSLIKYGSDHAIFDIKNIIKINIFNSGKLDISYDEKTLFDNNDISRIVFFESPVYWKMLSIIENSKDKNKKFLSNSITDERLSGVPKHFFDLKELLFANFKDGERPEFIIECANSLESQLQGKFNIADGDLTFKDHNGYDISKSLISFGMTNLGVLQAVLSKNIINKGSFVFIDEPESNLHPEWQAILADILVYLSKNGVHVIITTHSSDMLKAFEISTEERDIGQGLSTYYFQSTGELLSLIDEDFSPVELARRKLLETYERLMMRGYNL